MGVESVSETFSFLQSTYENLSESFQAQLQQIVDTVWKWTPTFREVSSKVPSQPATSGIESSYEKWLDQIKNHKYELAALGAFIGIGAYAYGHFLNLNRSHRKQTARKRRRVPKLDNGARKDVVLVVGLPTGPFTRLLALDFEKRGFIVYLTILDDKDYVYTQSNPITDDINYLNLCGGDSLEGSITKFHRLLQVPVVPIKGAQEHLLQLQAVVFAPNLYFPLGPLENLSGAAWESVLSRMALYGKLMSLGLLSMVRQQRSKIVAIVPNIVSTLGLAYHGPEVVLQDGIKDMFTVLANEVAAQGVSVMQVRLGNLNLSSHSRKSVVPAMLEAEIRSWSDELQSLYGTPFLRQQSNRIPTLKRLRSLSLLVGLHHLLFDLICSKNSGCRVVYYGTGALAYERLVAIVPLMILRSFL